MRLTEQTHIALNDMIRETFQEEKLGMVTPSIGAMCRLHLPLNGLLKIKCKGAPYVERRDGGINDSQMGEIYWTH